MIDKNIIKLIRLYVIGSLILFTITGASGVYLVVSRALQSQKVVDAQVEYQKALTENVGKPQMIIQEYRSPNK
jgi:hypothetical protein